MRPTSVEPVEIEPEKIKELEQAQEALTKDVRELKADWELPLVVKDGKIEQGIFWINGPFVKEFWGKARKKPKKATCTCTCGHKHVPKAQAAPAELKKAA